MLFDKLQFLGGIFENMYREAQSAYANKYELLKVMCRL